MKNYFFMNPAAGQGKGINDLIDDIERTSKRLGQDSKVYITKAVGDGERKARAEALALHGEEARFYACGGDGTNNEIINGAFGFDHISVGCIPIGTGNDTVRNFSEAGNFMDIEGQLKGISKKIDLMKYSGIINGKYQEKYCVNMFNIGFDCNVVELAGRLKAKPLIAGSMAYLMAVMGTFIEKKGISLKLTENEKVLIDGKILLCAIANGSYCGGGMYTAPQASMNDGYFDVNIINDLSRKEFLTLFPKYQKGTHLEVNGIENILTVKKCKRLTLEPKKDHFFLCADGEIHVAETVEIEMIHNGINFIVPVRHLEK